MADVEMLPWCGCWIFLGATNTSGYGRVVVGSKRDGSNRQKYVHRITSRTVSGQSPQGRSLTTRRRAVAAQRSVAIQIT